MKELLNGWGMHADKCVIENAGVNGDRQQRGRAIKKEGDGVEDGGAGRENKRGSCFCCLMKGSISIMLNNRVCVVMVTELCSV